MRRPVQPATPERAGQAAELLDELLDDEDDEDDEPAVAAAGALLPSLLAVLLFSPCVPSLPACVPLEVRDGAEELLVVDRESVR
jgi:hypothetical protein